MYLHNGIFRGGKKERKQILTKLIYDLRFNSISEIQKAKELIFKEMLTISSYSNWPVQAGEMNQESEGKTNWKSKNAIFK